MGSLQQQKTYCIQNDGGTICVIENEFGITVKTIILNDQLQLLKYFFV